MEDKYIYTKIESKIKAKISDFNKESVESNEYLRNKTNQKDNKVVDINNNINIITLDINGNINLYKK